MKHQGSYWVSDIPRLEDVRAGVKRTLDPLIWNDGPLNAELVVPAGFHTDGASLPFLLTAIWDRWESRTLRSAILHDFGYSTGSLGNKSAVDIRFHRGLLADHWPHAALYYFGVRYFGWYAWNWQRNVPEVDTALAAGHYKGGSYS